MTSTNDARRLAKLEAQATIDEATVEWDRGLIDEARWTARVSDALAGAYLRDDDPRWQSGFDGDPELWRQAREVVLGAVTGDGTFLDVGCANGHLMECLATWARERGWHLTMFGLELSPDLAAAARRRNPAWAEHIFEGNVIDWKPAMAFTYVRTGLEYVPKGRGAFLVDRLLRDCVAPGGRLIIGPVSDADLAETVATVTAAGVESSVASATDRNGKTRHVVWVAR